MDGEWRITDHPVLGPLPPARPIMITFDGRNVEGLEGDTIAAALWASGIRSTGAAGGTIYCGTGDCFACRVTVDGVQGVRACLVPIRPGMRVEPDPQSGEAHHES